ncbi:MAG TPA: DNA gyrase inhibitor YacG [Pyrinomonadaceae bacterium]|jgi:endogenous inhibitor of DNA gyrase (YacG/DUF329 family)|nr:DNA gyrase inhibitor YacG [Pyrinomonadaceae bacterium]
MKCPTCGQPAKRQDNPHRPFCSERCKLIDFSKWANEEYLVPGETRPLAENQENASAPETDTES